MHSAFSAVATTSGTGQSSTSAVNRSILPDRDMTTMASPCCCLSAMQPKLSKIHVNYLAVHVFSFQVLGETMSVDLFLPLHQRHRQNPVESDCSTLKILKLKAISSPTHQSLLNLPLHPWVARRSRPSALLAVRTSVTGPHRWTWPVMKHGLEERGCPRCTRSRGMPRHAS